MHKKPHLIKAAFLGALILTLTVFGVAFAVIYDTAVVNNYTVDFLGVEELGDGHTTRWSYAITEPQQGGPASGMSHWTLGIAQCGYILVKPLPGEVFTTLTSVAECGDGTYDCHVTDYDVVENDFGTVPGLTGIKYEYNGPEGQQLTGGTPPRTHIFKFDLYTESGTYLIGDTDVLVKTGGGSGAFELGLIQGPVCPSTAVSVVALGAGTNQYIPAFGLVTFLAVVLVGGGAYAFSRRQS